MARGLHREPRDCKTRTAIKHRIRHLPESFEEFTENLEDEEVPTLANTSHDSDSERPTTVAARQRSIHTHVPKDKHCEVCKRTKITRAPCRKRTGHKVLNAGSESRHNHRYSNRGTRFCYSVIQSYPCETKTLSGNGKIYGHFSRRLKSLKSFTLTIRWNVGKSCEDLSWNHRTSTPH